MSGPLFGVFIGTLLSSIALHWLYQSSAAKDEKRWRAETDRLRAEVARLRMTDAERDALVTLCGDSSKWANPHVQLLLQYLERNKLLGSTEPRT